MGQHQQKLTRSSHTERAERNPKVEEWSLLTLSPQPKGLVPLANVSSSSLTHDGCTEVFVEECGLQDVRGAEVFGLCRVHFCFRLPRLHTDRGRNLAKEGFGCQSWVHQGRLLEDPSQLCSSVSRKLLKAINQPVLIWWYVKPLNQVNQYVEWAFGEQLRKVIFNFTVVIWLIMGGQLLCFLTILIPT